MLAAAVMHASWNALVKKAGDRALILAAVALVTAVSGAALIALSASPAPVSWPWIAASTCLHYGYYILLFQAYRLGDLSLVYPISRGLAPALVALGAFLLIGEALNFVGLIGLATVCSGIGLLSLQSGSVPANGKAVGMALMLGLTIAAYSVSDGIGIRWSGNPTGYMGWLFLLEAPVALAVLGPRIAIRHPLEWKIFGLGLIGGALSVLAYGLVLYVKTIAPIASVSAIREFSVIIAALIGVVFLGERPWMGRMVSAIIVATGVLVLAVSD